MVRYRDNLVEAVRVDLLEDSDTNDNMSCGQLILESELRDAKTVKDIAV